MGKRSDGEGTAPRQRKDGIWYRAIRIEGTGKRKYLYAKTKAELDKKYKEFAKQIASGTYTEIRKQTVEEYMLNWLTTYKRIELKPKSYDTLESTIHHQIIPYFKGMQFFSVTHEDIQKFINQLNDDGRSYSIIRKAYLALNGVYKYAMMKDRLLKNPCFGVKLPKKAEKNVKSIQVLSKEQIKLYCEHATERYGNGKCVYRLGYGLVLILFTGLRLGEAAGLMWDDIDFQKRTLKVQRTLEYVKNRDGDENSNHYRLAEGTTKSKSSERTIPLNQTALNALVVAYPFYHPILYWLLRIV